MDTPYLEISYLDKAIREEAGRNFDQNDLLDLLAALKNKAKYLKDIATLRLRLDGKEYGMPYITKILEVLSGKARRKRG